MIGIDHDTQDFENIASDHKILIQNTICVIENGLKSLNCPAKITCHEFGQRREDLPGHEHFGFMDGISNFGVRGTYQTLGKPVYITPRYLDDTDERAHLYGLPGQVLVWPGEIILGLPKQNLDTTSGSEEAERPGSCDFAGPEWARNGSYLVYRRLKQDVAKFWNFMHRSVAEILQKNPCLGHVTAEDLSAKIIARWKSGTPIIRSPNGDNPDMGKDPLANNAFHYHSQQDQFLLKPDGNTDGFHQPEDDPFGKVCPMSGHLRKVQPRDASTDFGNSYVTLQHLIMRRGIQYGDVIQNERIDDGKDRGLMFVCYQKSIDNQFEFLITKWANSPSAPYGHGGHDMVIGQNNADDRARTFDIPLESGESITVTTTEEWVIPTGGGYFFMPSISALRNVIAKIE